MTNDLLKMITVDLLENEADLTLAEFCRACEMPAERVFELVAEGIIEPLGGEPSGWRFQGVSLRKVRCVQRLERDLGVNTAGAALALDLLDELARLRTRLRRFER